MVSKAWAVICPERDAPGVWSTWVKEKCVAIGWPPNKHHLDGPTDESNWRTARERAKEIAPGDVIIPYLERYRLGVPGKVIKVEVEDDKWKPTVAKGEFRRNRAEDELGRRIHVKWLTRGVPDLDEIAFVPRNDRTPGGEVRQTIERIRPERYARFMKIMGDRKNWKKYANILPKAIGHNLSMAAGPKHRGLHTKLGTTASAILQGDAKFLRRAREAFPLLVRQAQAGARIYYSDLADELGMANPRNLNYVLGAVGRAIQKLSSEWKEQIPPLQCLVVNKNTGLPGEGISWFVSDLKDFKRRTREERKQILGVELVKVFNYRDWVRVLASLGLKPVRDNPNVDVLINQARDSGGVGEGEDHRRLKCYIAENPQVVGLSGFSKGDTEYCFPSADRIDVVFHSGERWVGVEVKGPSSPDADVIRGMFQTVKYKALREAELRSKAQRGKSEVILVMSNVLPTKLKELKNLLGVTVMDGILVPA